MANNQAQERKWELGLTWEAQQLMGEQPTSLKDLSLGLARGAFAEYIGMLMFIFNAITIARFVGSTDDMATETSASTILIAFGFGISIFVLVFILAEASGANLNPAISFALVVSKRITVERFVFYVAAQVLGSLSGAILATKFLSGTGGGFNALAPGVSVIDAFGAEVLCTFFLVLTVFAACDGELGRKTGHTAPLLPLAIGMAVFVDHLVLIPIDGCSINPARSFATAFTNNKWADQWIFWAGPLTGGLLAATAWEAVLRPVHPAHNAALARNGEACGEYGAVPL